MKGQFRTAPSVFPNLSMSILMIARSELTQMGTNFYTSNEVTIKTTITVINHSSVGIITRLTENEEAKN
jgi:hypothetical protein